MKRLIAMLIATLLVCLLLAGCTPKDAKPTENGSTPTLNTDYIPSPEGTLASENDEDGEMQEEEDEDDNYQVEVGEDVGVGVGGN